MCFRQEPTPSRLQKLGNSNPPPSALYNFSEMTSISSYHKPTTYSELEKAIKTDTSLRPLYFDKFDTCRLSFSSTHIYQSLTRNIDLQKRKGWKEKFKKRKLSTLWYFFTLVISSNFNIFMSKIFEIWDIRM